MRNENFDNAVSRILKHDPRYPREAYELLEEIFPLALQRQREAEGSESNIVSGQALVNMFREYFTCRYGPFTSDVLDLFHIHSTDDIGAMVFNLVKVGVFGTNKGDSRADFHNLFDFDEAFRKPFLPEHPVPDFRPRRPSKKKDA